MRCSPSKSCPLASPPCFRLKSISCRVSLRDDLSSPWIGVSICLLTSSKNTSHWLDLTFSVCFGDTAPFLFLCTASNIFSKERCPFRSLGPVARPSYSSASVKADSEADVPSRTSGTTQTHGHRHRIARSGSGPGRCPYCTSLAAPHNTICYEMAAGWQTPPPTRCVIGWWK